MVREIDYCPTFKKYTFGCMNVMNHLSHSIQFLQLMYHCIFFSFWEFFFSFWELFLLFCILSGFINKVCLCDE